MLKSQELAYAVLNRVKDEKSRLSLLSYIARNKDNIDIDINISTSASNYYVYLLELFLNNLILPSTYVTAIFLSTHFNIIVNKELTNKMLSDTIVLDVSPIELETKWWNKEYTYKIRDIFSSFSKLKFNAQLRICDAFSNSGTVVWFNPFTEEREMSVRWGLNSYTVRNYATTCKMCSMAKRNYNDYVTAPPEILTK